MIPRATVVLNFSCGVVFLSAVWIKSLLNRNKFIKFLNKIVDFDIILQENCRIVNYQKSKKGVTRRLLTNYLFMTMYISFYSVFTTVKFDFYQRTGQCIGFTMGLVNSATCLQTVELVSILKLRFAILNQQIDEIVKYFNTNRVNLVMHSSNVQDRALALGKICTLHHHLSKLVKLFNDTFGVILLLMFGFSFIIITTMLFYVTAEIEDTMNWKNIMYVFMTGICYIVDTLWVCDVCHSTAEEGTRTGELIHKIETDDSKIIEEIEMFSLQMANQQVEFSAAGFFPINYTLVFSIIGGVTTYIIILIQLATTLKE
ncbi:hypothetical protein MTP99_000510 [Tenebrio molitor]|nr:hypothetical protein MTP99_000510 [Tenebrio molitor]